MSAKSIYRCKNSLSDTFYKLFSSFLNSKSISVNNFRLPDTFRTYFKMFICKKKYLRNKLYVSRYFWQFYYVKFINQQKKFPDILSGS